MGKKRIFGVIILLTLVLSIEGCESIKIAGLSLTGVATKEEKNLDEQKYTYTEEEVLKLGAEQTKSIKAILSKYGVKVSNVSDKSTTTSIAISKDENDCAYKGAKGYTITTDKEVKINDGGNHEYGIIYNAYKAENANEPNYVYQITMEFSTKEEFRIDNFKLFKELVKGIHGNNYDFVSLENFMKEQLKDAQSKGVVGGGARDVGAYRECIEDGGENSQEDTYTITYSITLKK